MFCWLWLGGKADDFRPTWVAKRDYEDYQIGLLSLFYAFPSFPARAT